jgi:hypothetical protein
MKVQLRVVMEDSTQWERWLFHFLTSLTQEKNYAHKGLFHFLTSLTQKRTMLVDRFHFLTRLKSKINYALCWVGSPDLCFIF